MIERTGRQCVGHDGPTAMLAESVRLRRLFAGSIVP